MRVKIKLLFSLLLFFIILEYSEAEETVYPAGHNIVATYELSSTDLEIGDTLLVIRTVTNNESFGLANLYLAENLPFEFSILSYSLEIDGAPILHDYSGPFWGEIFSSCNSYRWVIDDPAPSDTTNRILMPGESLVLDYSITCTTVGNYALPFHTLCTYGDTSGIFTVADSLTVTFSPGSGTGEELPILPVTSFVSSAYPNPFNGEVVIELSSLELQSGQVRLTIYDLAGARVFESEYAMSGEIRQLRWRPEKNVATGVYFYKLKQGVMFSTGKMTFLK